jgi:hypothetical protein
MWWISYRSDLAVLVLIACTGIITGVIWDPNPVVEKNEYQECSFMTEAVIHESLTFQLQTVEQQYMAVPSLTGLPETHSLIHRQSPKNEQEIFRKYFHNRVLILRELSGNLSGEPFPHSQE